MLGRMMRNVVYAKSGGAWICRMCDLAACGRAQGRCPAVNAAMGRVSMDPADDGTDPA